MQVRRYEMKMKKNCLIIIQIVHRVFVLSGRVQGSSASPSSFPSQASPQGKLSFASRMHSLAMTLIRIKQCIQVLRSVSSTQLRQGQRMQQKENRITSKQHKSVSWTAFRVSSKYHHTKPTSPKLDILPVYLSLSGTLSLVRPVRSISFHNILHVANEHWHGIFLYNAICAT